MLGGHSRIDQACLELADGRKKVLEVIFRLVLRASIDLFKTSFLFSGALLWSLPLYLKLCCSCSNLNWSFVNTSKTQHTSHLIFLYQSDIMYANHILLPHKQLLRSITFLVQNLLAYAMSYRYPCSVFLTLFCGNITCTDIFLYFTVLLVRRIPERNAKVDY